MKLSNREKDIVYFSLSRQLDDRDITPKEFNELDALRDKFN